MLRISRQSNGPEDHLRVEGKLVGPWVAELKAACDAAGGPKQVPVLNLSGLSYVDADGVQLLHRLSTSGYALIGCSKFVAELLRLEQNP